MIAELPDIRIINKLLSIGNAPGRLYFISIMGERV